MDARRLSIEHAAVHDTQRVFRDITTCPRCHKASLVRFEHVIRGSRSERHFYCGGCHYSWAVASDDGAKADEGRPSERSRSDVDWRARIRLSAVRFVV
jgi:hypothetical protein